MSEAREKLIELLNKTSEIYDVYLNAGYDNIYRFCMGQECRRSGTRMLTEHIQNIHLKGRGRLSITCNKNKGDVYSLSSRLYRSV